MTENAMLAIVLTVTISSCAAESIYEKYIQAQPNAEAARVMCVKKARTQSDRIECLKSK